MARRLHVAYALALCVYLALPLLMAIPVSLSGGEVMRFPPHGISLRWYEAFVTDPIWLAAATKSLALGAGSATAAVLVAGLAAWPLARRRFRGREAVAVLLVAPVVVPGVAIAVGAFIVWANLHLLGSPIALLATHTVLAAPLVLLIVGAAAVGFDERQIGAARTLGAGPWAILRRVLIPQMRPALVAAWLFAFVTSLDEVVITGFLLTAGQTPTLAVHIFNQVSWSSSPVIAASSVVLGMVALVVGVVVARLVPARMGA